MQSFSTTRTKATRPDLRRQRHAVAHSLPALGLHSVRPPPNMSSQTDPLFADTATLTPRGPQTLSKSE